MIIANRPWTNYNWTNINGFKFEFLGNKLRSVVIAPIYDVTKFPTHEWVYWTQRAAFV